MIVVLGHWFYLTYDGVIGQKRQKALDAYWSAETPDEAKFAYSSMHDLDMPECDLYDNGSPPKPYRSQAQD